MCLNLAGWPREDLPLDMLARVLEGGAAVAHAAGALVVGGHTVDDPEPKYGMAVVGLVHPDRVVTNAGARVGDVLVLTKPLGLGVITTGIKNELTPPLVAEAAVATMTLLNAAAAEAMRAVGVDAATDVTGFGLLGHLHQMLRTSGVSAEISAGRVPVLDGARALADEGQIPGGTRRNRASLEGVVTFDEEVDETTRWILSDAQTSGGLLIAVADDGADRLEQALLQRGALSARIGAVTNGEPGAIAVNP